MIERSSDVARIQTNPTMRLTLDIARRKWEESGREVEWAKIIRRLFGPNRPFFGKQSNISPVCAMLAYKCHTWLESCWKCGFLGENSFGSSLILWAQGILSSRDQEPDPLAYTSLYSRARWESWQSTKNHLGISWLVSFDGKLNFNLGQKSTVFLLEDFLLSKNGDL